MNRTWCRFCGGFGGEQMTCASCTTYVTGELLGFLPDEWDEVSFFYTGTHRSLDEYELQDLQSSFTPRLSWK